MRSIGQQLGVEAMSLYRHVQNKEDVLDGMVDLVFGEIELSASEPDWRAAMRRRAISARAVLHRHPWAIGLTESCTQPGPTTLKHHDAVLGMLGRAGFSSAQTTHAYNPLDSYIHGFAV
jgi:AcrR family transcriptional regulator